MPRKKAQTTTNAPVSQGVSLLNFGTPEWQNWFDQLAVWGASTGIELDAEFGEGNLWLVEAEATERDFTSQRTGNDVHMTLVWCNHSQYVHTDGTFVDFTIPLESLKGMVDSIGADLFDNNGHISKALKFEKLANEDYLTIVK